MLDKTKLARISAAIFIVSSLFLFSFYAESDISLAQEMQKLGMETPSWLNIEYSQSEINKGQQLVEEGSLGGLSKRISPFFVCTDCHSPVRDVANYTQSLPEENANYAKQNNLPYLPAASFYGMINKTEFYAGDYEKKYGFLAIKARNSLDNAIQLCSQECSQGRKLTPAELGYVKAYLKSKELLLSDLFKNTADNKRYKALSKRDKAGYINQNFTPKSNNTFVTTNLNDLNNLEGNVQNGAYLLKFACMKCHQNERISYYEIADTKLSKNNLLKKLNNKENELLSIIRYGTQPLPGNKAYMPVFTQEKLSNQQIADLIAYLNEK